MVSAVGSPPASSAGSTTGTGTAGIEAQIVRYKKKLAECVNCESAKTPEGKQNIQAITNKISAAQARIDKINTDKPARQPSATAANNTAANTYAAASTAESKTSAESISAPNSPGSTTGSRVDVFA